MYAPLWVKSNFSFLEGASHPDELVETCARFGIQSMAITDRDGVYGVVRAHLKARELGVHLVVGSEITVEDGTTIVLLVQNRAGYANLCKLITCGRLRCEKGESRVSWQEVCDHAEHLLALWGGDRSLLIAEREEPGVFPSDTPLSSENRHADPATRDRHDACDPLSPLQVGAMLKAAFGDRLYAMVARHLRAEEAEQEVRLRTRARVLEIPCVATTEVLYHTAARRPLQDVLTCIKHGVTVHTAGTLTRPNDGHALRPPAGFRELFTDDLVSVAMTREIAERCVFNMDELRYVYPSEDLPNGRTSADWLRELTFEGAHQRYGDLIPPEVVEQLEKELRLIEKLDYCGYFLTMRRLVEYCRDHAILCQGRGSAANSAVCYCLGVTAVDPIRLDLLFERFISEERAEPPDIDLDIEHNRREEVIQYVYEAYGREKAAMVANVIRYRSRSAVREVGKALGLPQTALDRLAKLLSHYREPGHEDLLSAGLNPEVHTHALFVRLVNEILDFPRHLGIHPGGFLLGHEAVHRLVPIENASMEDRTVIQWDKYDVEALGLFKVDLLGLGALHQLHLGFDLLSKHRGLALSMATMPPGDPATYEMIQQADTVGTFQIESRAQMSMLPRLKPKTFYDLVIEVSIVRPGPITGGMVHPYLRRRRGEEPVVYPHESLRPVLEKTLGVPLFQEQVMKLAVVAADYTPGEADQLRRDMAAWRRSGRIERHRDRLIARMVGKGIAREFAERVFEQIRGFGEYGFPESHAASFALISYATSYMKCHFPAEFCCSLLNAQPMGFYSAATIVHDAQRHGVEVRPIDLRLSEWDCTLEPLFDVEEPVDDEGRPLPPRFRRHPDPRQWRFAVRMGLRYVKGLGKRERARLEEVCMDGPFCSPEDVARRTGFDERVLTALAESGAFDGFDLDRREALWRVRQLARSDEIPLDLEDPEPLPLFPKLNDMEEVAWDYRISRHSTRGHLLEPLRAAIRAQGLPSATTVNSAYRDRSRIRYAGLVICRQRPGTAKGVTFMTLEDETGFVNVVIWQDIFDKYSVIARTEPFLGITGKLQKQDGIVHLIAQKLWRPNLPAMKRHNVKGPKSRDFH